MIHDAVLIFVGVVIGAVVTREVYKAPFELEVLEMRKLARQMREDFHRNYKHPDEEYDARKHESMYP